jgi:hypothetical protein
MSESPQDEGLAQVLLERLNTQVLPRALELKAKVDRGEALDQYDTHFMEGEFAEASHLLPLINQHPEYQHLFGRLMSLSKEIMEKALENAKKA